jgi:hypothetical protein
MIKPVQPDKKELLEKVVIGQSQPRNLHSVVDRDDSVPGALLMYANYGSVDETKRARERIEYWLDNNWEWSNRPIVALKAAQQEIYYGIHVQGLPHDADIQEVEAFFAQFGQLHPFPKVHMVANKEGEAFVNFVSLASAERAVEASFEKSLLFENSMLVAHAGRNMERPKPSAVAGKVLPKHKTQVEHTRRGRACMVSRALLAQNSSNRLGTAYEFQYT